jgi:twitching motility protein PilT
MNKALQDLIATGRERGASDLHLEAGSPAVFRIRGELIKVGDLWTGEVLSQIAQQLLGAALGSEFQHKRSVDLSRTISGVRCRINCFQTVRGVSFAIRLLSSFRNTIRDSNLHPDLKKLIEHETGLVIISGPTGTSAHSGNRTHPRERF